MIQKIAFYIDAPEVMRLAASWNPKIKEHDFIVDLYKNYVIIDVETGDYEIAGKKGLTRRFDVESLYLSVSILTEKED